MAKPLKIAAILVGVVIGLLALLAVVLTIVIDPNRYRDDIVQAVKTQTGRDLAIDGDLSLSLFPWLGLETGRLALANASGFGPEPFAVVGSTEVKVELLPLLRRRVVVDAVRVNGLKLQLERRANGRTNWEDLAGEKAGPPGKPAPAPEPAPEKDAGAALALFTIERVELRDAELTWRDEVAGAAYVLRDVNMRSGDLLGSSPAPLQLAFDLESSAPKMRRRVELDARLRLDLQAETLELPALRVTLGDLQVQAKLAGSDVLSAPKLTGSIEIPSFNPRPLLQQLGVEYAPADGNALRKLALATQLESTPKALALSDLRITLDSTQLTGSLALQHDPAGAYRFDIGLDDIDIDRYLPAAEATDKADDKLGGAEAVVIPVALLQDADAQGQLRIRKLKAFGIRSQEVTANVTARGGRITFGPNQAKLYDGAYAGRTVIDVSTRVPRLQFDEKLSGVQLGPLLKDIGTFDHYTGTGNVELKLTAQGGDADALTRTLSGTAAMQLRDGTIEGVNLQKLVLQARELITRLRGGDAEAATRPTDETAFKSLSATIQVKNGIARNDDLKLDGAVVRAQGAGTANLVEQTLDYRLQVTLAEDATRTGTTVPVRIRGSLDDLKYGLELETLIKEQIKERTRPLEQQLEQRLEKKLDEQLDRLRQKLRR